jgi:acyl-coenzyme A synthetase/AMP-(fatty) acid ligase
MAGTHPAVVEAAGVAVADRDGFVRITLFIAGVKGGHGNDLAGKIERYLGDRLPPFKRPRWIRVVDELPKTVTGKVRKVQHKRMIEGDGG